MDYLYAVLLGDLLSAAMIQVYVSKTVISLEDGYPLCFPSNSLFFVLTILTIFYRHMQVSVFLLQFLQPPRK